MAIIDISHLSKRYGDKFALNDISLQVEPGLFGLLGPNGSGKTTMIKCLTGQIKPSEGALTVMDISVNQDPIRIREIVGIVPEQETPPSFLTAEEYLHFVARIRKIDPKPINWWFKYLDFNEQRKMLCKDLSRGTRQKLMFAQAFLHKPKVAMIDEPLINLDPLIQKKVKDFLKGEVKKGSTIFISTHVLEIAEEICTSFAILKDGKLIYTGKNKHNLKKLFLSKCRS